MRNIIILLMGFTFFTNQAQKKDTIFIKFNDSFKGTKKESYQFSPNSSISFGYYIKQMEKETYGDTHFLFSHASRDEKTYKKFGGQHPAVLKKHKTFLKDKKVLDISFFRTTPYLEVCKTFDEEDSWEQDVVIFMMDVDEMKNDSIVLREVRFSRPVKE